MNRVSLSFALIWLAAGVAGYAARVGLSGKEGVPPPGTRGRAEPSPAVRAGKCLGGNKNYLGTLAKAREEDMVGLFAEYDAIADPRERQDALNFLVARWVELNPQAALDFFKERNSRGWVQDVLVRWALLQPAAVVAVLQESDRGLAPVDSILRAVALIDAKAAVRLLLAFPEGEPILNLLSSSEWRKMVVRMAHEDFEGVLKALDRFAAPGGYERVQVMEAIASGRALGDPDGALEWARGLEKGSTGAVRAVLETISSRDPARAAREFLMTPKLMAAAAHGSSEGYLLEEIAVQLGKSDPAAALRWIREAAGQEENVPELAQMAAARILQQALRDPSRLAEVFTVIQGDLNAEAHMFPNSAVDGKLGAALEAVSALPAGEARDRLLANLAAYSGRSDPMGSLKWLEKITDPKAREAFAAKGSIPPGPEAAALSREFYEALPPDLKSTAAARLAQTQALDNGPAAAGWAQSLTDELARQKALTSALSAWTSRDSGPASTWVDELPPGPERDAAASGLVRGIMRREPSSAFIWAMSIEDPAQQSASLLSTLDHWRENDPDAASVAVQAAGLPEARRTELLKFIHSKERWNDPSN